MPDREVTPEGKPLPWTGAAKLQFLFRVVEQLKDGKRSIKWERLNIPGRTPKSLQNTWAKISKEVADYEKTQEKRFGAAITWAPKKASRSGPSKKSNLAGFDEDVDDEIVLKQEKLSKKRDNDEATDSKKMKMEDDIDHLKVKIKKENGIFEI